MAVSVDALSPMSKEGLWQNWMSTSGSAQLESESHISNGNHHYGSPNCVHGSEGDQMCMMHEYEYNSSHMPRLVSEAVCLLVQSVSPSYAQVSE